MSAPARRSARAHRDHARRRRARLRLLGAASGVAVSHVVVRSGRSERVDRLVARAIARPLGASVDVAVAAFTDLGSVYGVTGLALALGAAGRRRAALDAAGAGAAAWCLAQGLKPTVGRDRPFESHGTDRIVALPAGSSWPSGHVAVAAAVAEAVRPQLRRRYRALPTVVVAGVAASRLYVGVHHFTDVAAGAGVGTIVAAGWRRARTAAGWRRARIAARRRAPPTG